MPINIRNWDTMKRLTKAIILLILTNLSISIFAQPPRTVSGEKRPAPAQQRYFSPFKPKLSKEQEQKLFPNSSDLNKYAEFLKSDKTGLIRIFPELDCESRYVLRADEVCAENIPGSSNYSFRKKEYTNDFLADIRLKGRLFISDGVLTQSFLVNLGDIQLENLALNSDGMEFLTKFNPEPENRDAMKQYNDLANGIRLGKYEYRKVAVAAENTTYAIRVVAYKASIYRNYRGWAYNILDGDKRVDIIVAFRVIRKDPDGSLTLLWKELDRKKSVKLKATKPNEKKK